MGQDGDECERGRGEWGTVRQDTETEETVFSLYVGFSRSGVMVSRDPFGSTTKFEGRCSSTGKGPR